LLETPTQSGSVKVQTRMRGWACDATFLVMRKPALSSHRAVSRHEAERVAAAQDAYAATRSMITVDGAIGAGPMCRLPVRLHVEEQWAAIAAVQKLLYFGLSGSGRQRPGGTVVCTPGLRMPDYPEGRVVTVDLGGSVTRVCGTDFCGEPKRAGLRMWSKQAWDLGALPLHAAATFTGRTGPDRRIALLVGRPGTGKSTLVFADGTGGVACQEDRVAWMPDGSLVPAESAFFAPVALMAESTLVRNAVREPTSYLLNPPAGRVVFGDGGLAAAAIAGERPSAVILLVRNQNVLPAVARLDRETAAAVYVAALEGSAAATPPALRRLGANPLLPLSAVAQGARLLELLVRHHVETYVLNTGRVGGPSDRAGSRDITPRHSAAIVAALLGGGIQWDHETSLGCDVARGVPGLEARDSVLLAPASLYRRQGRDGEYTALANRLMRRWAESACRLADFGTAVAA
jgi:ATP-dependent phosphoenolpyruvate carboxykinase